jgi:predicted amidophosphoribosyltransferase
VCLFLGEYTARKGFAHSATNNLIINFKKPLDRKGKPEWPHKARNIRKAANALYKAFGNADLRSYTFVPVPPSKARTDPLYDDRMMVMLGIVSELFYQNRGYHLDIRELVEQTQSTAAAHDADVRPEPSDLTALYEIQQGMVPDAQDRIVICDDVLTTGCHFRAMEMVILEVIPNATIRGMFLARREPEAIDFSDFDFDL